MTLHLILNRDDITFAYTYDSEGFYFYDSMDEVREAVGDMFTSTRTHDSLKAFEDWRYSQ